MYLCICLICGQSRLRRVCKRRFSPEHLLLAHKMWGRGYGHRISKASSFFIYIRIYMYVSKNGFMYMAKVLKFHKVLLNLKRTFNFVINLFRPNISFMCYSYYSTKSVCYSLHAISRKSKRNRSYF